MQESLKAWVQDPDDWKLNFNPKPAKPGIIKRIVNWFKSLINTPIGFFLFLVFLNSLGYWLTGTC